MQVNSRVEIPSKAEVSIATCALQFRKIAKPFCCNLPRGCSRGESPSKGRVAYERGLNCRPLWHFCKQKLPIPSQLPQVFGFGLRSDGGFGEKLRWRAYKVGNNLCFEGIGAICEANRRKGALPPSMEAHLAPAAHKPDALSIWSVR